MATQPKHLISVEEYLEQEEAALDRHEYLDGEIFAMAGTTLAHGLIASNITAEISLQLRNTECRVRGSDTRLRTSPTGLYSYPDAVISCRPELSEGTTLLNPIVIVEVLSDSTEDYDRGKKFERYRQISSFREYVVVAQDRLYVEHHVRQESSGQSAWIMRQLTAVDSVISLDSISVSLPLAAIYANVELQLQ